MSILVSLSDSEGRIWDFNAVSPSQGLAVLNGSADAFDSGLRLRKNGLDFPIVDATLTGRELTTQPVISNGIAIQRSILVSDTTISTTGFARFLDSFTNTTDSEQTFTFTISTNSGADSATVTPVTTSGDTALSADDFGYTVDEVANLIGGDSAVMHAYGDGLGQMPTLATRSNDIFNITYTLTLAAGETQSILSFATQSATAAEAAADLPTFTTDLSGLNTRNFLAGLSREEIQSVVNYTGAADVVPPFELVGSDGHRWGIDLKGRLSSLDTGALQGFSFLPTVNSFGVSTGATSDPDTGTVTVSYTALGASDATATFEYTALPDSGVIRLLLSVQSATSDVFVSPASASLAGGANPLQTVFTATTPGGAFPGLSTASVLDDSNSGSGGTLPALTFGYGATAATDLRNLSGNTFTTIGTELSGATGELVQFVYFFALNDTGLQGIIDANAFAAPDFRLLSGLSAAEVANLRNFDLDETDRLQTTLGDGNDNTITGHTWGDSIDGAAGADDIFAGGSDDVVLGGDGDDAIDGEDGDDTLSGGAQADAIDGGNGNDSVTGDDGDDTLNGQAGNDTLSGGTGADTIRGSSGDDAVNGDDGADRLRGNGGNDTLQGGTGADWLDGGTDSDTLEGGTDADTLLGQSGADTLAGEAGNDSLDGGDGDDTLNGGAGNDILSGGAGGDSLIGGNGDDTLTGGDASDTALNRLFGGQDSDTYIVTSANDRVTDIAGGLGTDIVLSDITFTLAANIENLELRETATALDATGNGQNNRITGNTNANQIDGGLGADTMEGGNGDDGYRVDDAGDVVTELNGTAGGIDTISTTISLTLAANVENLTLLNNALANGTGNDAANQLLGNIRVNVLDGGLGDDTLTGGGGNDAFLFSTALGAGNVDHITDFTIGSDRIQLDDAIFSTLATGTLRPTAFVLGSTALDASDRILYDQSTGTILYDADGDGSGAAVAFAVVDNLAALTNASFLIV